MVKMPFTVWRIQDDATVNSKRITWAQGTGLSFESSCATGNALVQSSICKPKNFCKALKSKKIVSLWQYVVDACICDLWVWCISLLLSRFLATRQMTNMFAILWWTRRSLMTWKLFTMSERIFLETISFVMLLANNSARTTCQALPILCLVAQSKRWERHTITSWVDYWLRLDLYCSTNCPLPAWQ